MVNKVFFFSFRVFCGFFFWVLWLRGWFLGVNETRLHLDYTPGLRATIVTAIKKSTCVPLLDLTINVVCVCERKRSHIIGLLLPSMQYS